MATDDDIRFSALPYHNFPEISPLLQEALGLCQDFLVEPDKKQHLNDIFLTLEIAANLTGPSDQPAKTRAQLPIIQLQIFAG